MKRIVIPLLFLPVLSFWACSVDNPQQAQVNTPQNELVLRKAVAIGNSITMGFQSAGIVEDFQTHDYSYYITQQAGIQDFQQPLVAAPGIGSSPGKTPLLLVKGQITSENLNENPLMLLLNKNLPRPYDNLGVAGATLHDVLTATTSTNSSNPTNLFFDVVLRNPTFGNMTILDQAILLNPSLVFVWIGNNPILGAALEGSSDPQFFVPQGQFDDDYSQLLTRLRTALPHALILTANIPNVTEIPYVNMLDAVFRVVEPGAPPVPVLFQAQPNPATGGIDFVPIDFGGGLYLPLLTAEQGVEHLLLPALSEYQANGLGVPDSTALVDVYHLQPPQASAIVANLRAGGLNPSGMPFTGSLTLTVDEVNAITTAIDGYDATITTLADEFQLPAPIDSRALLNQVNQFGMDGVTGKFVLVDPANTGFSLDGVHPNNAGQALIANAFIQSLNEATGLTVPEVNAGQLRGQYVGTLNAQLALQAATQVKSVFVKPQK